MPPLPACPMNDDCFHLRQGKPVAANTVRRSGTRDPEEDRARPSHRLGKEAHGSGGNLPSDRHNAARTIYYGSMDVIEQCEVRGGRQLPCIGTLIATSQGRHICQSLETRFRSESWSAYISTYGQHNQSCQYPLLLFEVWRTTLQRGNRTAAMTNPSRIDRPSD